MIDKAAFSLEKYTFNKVKIDFDSNTRKELKIAFVPSGVFKQTETESTFELKLVFSAQDEVRSEPFIVIECNSIFKFADNISFEEVPSFFYANSIAILFPYIRAFVSTVTLQANILPLVLPTMNLSSLEKPLRENTRAQ